MQCNGDGANLDMVSDAAGKRPSLYKLPVTPVSPVRTERDGNRIFADFGRESMGYLRLDGVKGNGVVHISYGESADEARDKNRSYLRDKVSFTGDSVISLRNMSASRRAGDAYRLPESRAVRYALVECDGGMSLDGVTLMSEMKDLGTAYRGSFECDDTLLNRIFSGTMGARRSCITSSKAARAMSSHAIPICSPSSTGSLTATRHRTYCATCCSTIP